MNCSLTCCCIGPPGNCTCIRGVSQYYLEPIPQPVKPQVLPYYGQITVYPMGCICPPKSEETCKNKFCPRKEYK